MATCTYSYSQAYVQYVAGCKHTGKQASKQASKQISWLPPSSSYYVTRKTQDASPSTTTSLPPSLPTKFPFRFSVNEGGCRTVLSRIPLSPAVSLSPPEEFAANGLLFIALSFIITLLPSYTAVAVLLLPTVIKESALPKSSSTATILGTNINKARPPKATNTAKIQ